ncbi:phytoene desaturase [Verrucomicrobium sp. GAS474]|uniref:phytoene desaturase family protein n=1 Tax=Verrucomicrobium sp. GAS474 TaxID=1882831 RepID=UPI00087C0ED1|nr:phytoene desaturase family protein [Verrucomicrobium sp. GAS474]SDU01190.1 phytoene desaturase [Verrucomicrobium sp. GAS474]
MFKPNRSNQGKKAVVVVGAGLGGMAAALRLACAGHRVEVWEKNAAPGGKLQERREAGFRWDLGPSLLTMPHVLDALFATAGEKREDWLTLERLPSACRYFWGDGTTLDEDAPFWARPDVARFLAHAEGIDALSGEAFLHYPPAEFWRAFTWRNLAHLRHLPKVMNCRTLEEEIARHIADPKVRQLFARFATYNGSHPARTPATFSIIPYIEARYGAWYVRGGMAAIGAAVHRLAEARGVRFRFGTEARSWRKEGGEHLVEDGAGTASRFDAVICNQDVLQASQGWLRAAFAEREKAALLRPALSTSALVVTLGLARRLPHIGHHSIFFSSDYAAEFAALFDRKTLPEEPTVYLASTCRTDPADAPPGGENVFLLVNAPAASALSPAETEAYVARVCAALPGRFPRLALPDLWREAIPGTRQIFTPADFARRDGSRGGALYGWASHSLRTAFLRPPISRRGVARLHFVGGTTHPGGGIPLVLLSANMVAERVDF